MISDAETPSREDVEVKAAETDEATSGADQYVEVGVDHLTRDRWSVTRQEALLVGTPVLIVEREISVIMEALATAGRAREGAELTSGVSIGTIHGTARGSYSIVCKIWGHAMRRWDESPRAVAAAGSVVAASLQESLMR